MAQQQYSEKNNYFALPSHPAILCNPLIFSHEHPILAMDAVSLLTAIFLEHSQLFCRP
ncbi:MAG: hypothetical protein M1294_01870 [Firmicutes bacterium]|nr:hypothetical protein [Bacillota bacterium]